MRWRTLRCGVLSVVAFAVLAGPAGACGGLVGENGTIKLARTSTLAVYSDGVERYVTSFEFTGEGEEVGSIIPLPGVPTKVERGGDWTLQRLEQELAPKFSAGDVLESRAASPDAEVLLETTVDALDITILRGGGGAVGRWAIDHGFLLTPDAPEVLDFYSRRSKVFMAARFDASRAKELGQQGGDGTPIMLTIPTKEPWVPLRILGLGSTKSEIVQADVFLLTPEQPQLLAGNSGLSLDRSEPASDDLLADLRSDKGMRWVPSKMWLSSLALDAPAGDLDYDLAISTHAGVAPSATAAGLGASALPGPLDAGAPLWPLWVAALMIPVGAGAVILRRQQAHRALAHGDGR